jgi:hypothetical protein
MAATQAPKKVTGMSLVPDKGLDFKKAILNPPSKEFLKEVALLNKNVKIFEKTKAEIITQIGVKDTVGVLKITDFQDSTLFAKKQNRIQKLLIR